MSRLNNIVRQSLQSRPTVASLLGDTLADLLWDLKLRLDRAELAQQAREVPAPHERIRKERRRDERASP